MVDLDKNIEMKDVQPNCRVALRNDSYKLHKILPNKVRPTPPPAAWPNIRAPPKGGPPSESDDGGEGPRLNLRHDRRS